MRHEKLIDALCVFLGGSAGTAGRLALDNLPYFHTHATVGGVPMSLIAANLLGTFVLGFLAGTAGLKRRAYLLLGTGMAGGFTSYSALALAATHSTQHLLVGFLAGVGLLVTGLCVAGTGVAVAGVVSRALHRDAHEAEVGTGESCVGGPSRTQRDTE